MSADCNPAPSLSGYLVVVGHEWEYLAMIQARREHEGYEATHALFSLQNPYLQDGTMST